MRKFIGNALIFIFLALAGLCFFMAIYTYNGTLEEQCIRSLIL